VRNLDSDRVIHSRSHPRSPQKLSLTPAPPPLVCQNVWPRPENSRKSTPPPKNVFPILVKPITMCLGRPCTPPWMNSEHHLCAARTLLSHLGVHMSPSTSLAHYKSHLDPLPIISLPHGDANNTPTQKRTKIKTETPITIPTPTPTTTLPAMVATVTMQQRTRKTCSARPHANRPWHNSRPSHP
jgi:hypothetical protein